MAKNVSLPMELADTLDKCLYSGMDKTKSYDIIPGFTITLRTLTGEEEIECRGTAGEFRGPAYIYTYKAKVLSYVICELNGLEIPPKATLKVPKERTDASGHSEEVLTDVLLSSHLEGIIMTWSKSLIDICFKLWSKHQEDQLFRYIEPLGQENVFSVEEKILAKEYRRILDENNNSTVELTPEEVILAAQNSTPATDLVKIGSRVKEADPHIDFSESDS